MQLITADGLYPPHTNIELRSRLNNPIDNIQAWQHGGSEWRLLDEEPNKWARAGAVRIGEPCPVYNCHGLTFASRRTQVDGTTTMSILRILEEDGYTEVPEPLARIGDVIVYYDSEGRAEHSGIVVSRPDANIIQVWSKWGRGFEMVHPAGSCLWGAFLKKFYRITKWKYDEIFQPST